MHGGVRLQYLEFYCIVQVKAMPIQQPYRSIVLTPSSLRSVYESLCKDASATIKMPAYKDPEVFPEAELKEPRYYPYYYRCGCGGSPHAHTVINKQRSFEISTMSASIGYLTAYCTS